MKIFYFVFAKLPSENTAEPLLNILCNFEKGEWKVILFPREKQRPSHFYREGEERIVVGPASVELGGVLILPRLKDFEKITKKTVKEIYSEVTISEEIFDQVQQQIKSF